MSRGRGLCPGGSLSKGALSRWSLSRGSLSRRVSVQWGLSGRSLSGRRPLYGYVWVVRILLTCILVLQFFAENCMKMKEFGPRGGPASLPPPSDSPMNVNST